MQVIRMASRSVRRFAQALFEVLQTRIPAQEKVESQGDDGLARVPSLGASLVRRSLFCSLLFSFFFSPLYFGGEEECSSPCPDE